MIFYLKTETFHTHLNITTALSMESNIALFQVSVLQRSYTILVYQWCFDFNMDSIYLRARY